MIYLTALGAGVVRKPITILLWHRKTPMRSIPATIKIFLGNILKNPQIYIGKFEFLINKQYLNPKCKF
jgi:hypothetical protein